MPYIITSLTTKSNYKLRLIYSNGSEIIVYFQPIISQSGVFAPLSNPEFFSQVKLGEDGRYIEWNGGIDCCADALWFEAHPNDNLLSLSSIEYA
ncbi:MAG: DUF2442 domain-containing protein [Trichodesmium sp. MO_231.B1]|nr:DUF2442 domain-containing protein [Trichodesmium sp. MO_231.B1]